MPAPPRGIPAPAARRLPTNGLAPPQATSASTEITQAIRAIRASDPSQSVDALKRVQKLLVDVPGRFEGSVPALLQAIINQTQAVFSSPESLAEPRVFRLAKHLIQTLNNFCDQPRLIKEMGDDDMETLLWELTLRLLETDDATGDAKELSRFINMIILRIFNGGKREVVFQ
jgi:cytoskeleton-associated protein 5